MRRRSWGSDWVVTVMLVFVVFCVDPSNGIETQYVEDFTTTTYMDPLNSTARWNTVVGELELFSLPTLAGSYDTPGTANGVYVSGDHAFVADGASGLVVVDISDPMSPIHDFE